MEIFSATPNWHTIWIHFSFAPVIISLALFLFAMLFRGKPIHTELNTVAHWLLWFGTLGSFLATVSGQIAYGGIDHDMQTHLKMIIHLKSAWPALIMLIICASYSYKSYRNNKKELGPVFLSIFLVSNFLLILTFNQGRVLVYGYGGGVDTLPNLNVKCEEYNRIETKAHENIFQMD